MSHNARSSVPVSLRAGQNDQQQMIGDRFGQPTNIDVMQMHYEYIELLQQLKTQVEGVHCKLSGQVKAFYTVNEVAELLDRTSGTVRRWVRSGKLRANRVKGTGPRGLLRISREALRSLLDGGFDATIPGLNSPQDIGVDAAQPSAIRIASPAEKGARDIA